MQQQREFAERIAAYMQHMGYRVSKDPGTVNTVYIEGCNLDGTPNQDLPNRWNDLRVLLDWNNGWDLRLNVNATTEPGAYYTQNPLNKWGAARIAFGQYAAWQFGYHQGTQPALVQVKQVKVHRDINKDGKRSPNDPIEWALIGLNQHTTRKGSPPELVGKYSAGCLVGRLYSAHETFLGIQRTDVRYLDAPKDYLFEAAILAGDKFNAFFK